MVRKIVQLFVLAACLLAHPASSALLSELTPDLVGEIAKNLSPDAKVNFALTSRAVHGAVDLHSIRFLVDTVRRLEQNYAGFTREAFYNIPRELRLMTVPDAQTDDFYVVKSSKHLYAEDDHDARTNPATNRYVKCDRKFINANLKEMKGKTTAWAKSNPRLKLSLDRYGHEKYTYARIQVDANFHKYGTSNVIECIHKAYKRIKKECIDGFMFTRNYKTYDGPAKKLDPRFMAKRCAAYSFMCSISYYMN